MGEVWRAFDTVTERIVAVKVLPAYLVDDHVYQQRFRREALAAAGLTDPHVVPIHDFGEIEGRLFVNMRLIEGQDLQNLLEQGPLQPTRAVAIIEQIASALHAAHRIGLVHRDVKPSNILVAEEDFAYLIDFGIARATGETRLTSTGSTVGTWAYMAPERFSKGVGDARADVYSLACVLYQSLTNQVPFPGESLEQIVAAHMFSPPPKPSAIHDGIPLAMDEVIATGMAKDPDHRYQSAKELAQAARAALTGLATQPGTIARTGATTAGHPLLGDTAQGGATLSANGGAASRYAAAQGSLTQQAPFSPPYNAYAAHPVEYPSSQRLSRSTKIVLSALSLLAISLVVLVAVVIGHKSRGGVVASTTSPATSPTAASSTTTANPTATPTSTLGASPPTAPGSNAGTTSDINTLAGSLSKGYGLNNCTAQNIVSGELAAFSCGQNPDPSGPIQAKYILFSNANDLAGSFKASIKDDVLTSCGDAGQSPTTWRQGNNANAGSVACGTYQNGAEIIWTTDAKNILSLIHAPNNDVPALYQWWRANG
jgi:serine/threonine-protein kinase